MQVGVIGVGSMGKNHARVYSELKGIDNVYVTDLNQEVAKKVADANGAMLSSKVEYMLNCVDAVSICVPTEYHKKIALEAFKAGVHVLIEKPVCSSVAAAEFLIRESPKDLIIGVGQIERFNPIVNEIHKMINYRPAYIETKRHNPASARSSHSIVQDLMIHDIDVVFNILDNPKCTSMTSSGTNDICGALFNLDGTTAYMSASRKASKKIRTIYIEQEDCTIEGDYMTQEITIYSKPGRYNIESNRYVQENVIEKVLVTKQEPLKQELSTFINCVKNKTPFPVTLEQATFNLRIAEQIEKGVRT